MKIEKWNDVHGNTTPDERMVAFRSEERRVGKEV